LAKLGPDGGHEELVSVARQAPQVMWQISLRRVCARTCSGCDLQSTLSTSPCLSRWTGRPSSVTLICWCGRRWTISGTSGAAKSGIGQRSPGRAGRFVSFPRGCAPRARQRPSAGPAAGRPEVVRAAARARNCGHRGIARAGVVLSRRLAGCQSEAVPHVL